jgi:hypothetical protein
MLKTELSIFPKGKKMGIYKLEKCSAWETDNLFQKNRKN